MGLDPIRIADRQSSHEARQASQLSQSSSEEARQASQQDPNSSQENHNLVGDIPEQLRDELRRRFIASLVVHLPTSIAIFALVGVYWDKDRYCFTPFDIWCLVQGIKIFVNVLIATLGYYASETDYLRALFKKQTYVTFLAFGWFAVGHVFLVIGRECIETSSVLYWLTLSLIAVEYLQFLLPIFVFCLSALMIFLGLSCIRLIKPSNGASKELLKNIPSLKYSSVSFTEKGLSKECPVCLAEFEEDDTIGLLPCSHVFHKNCIDNWLALNATCPVCRVQITRKELRSKRNQLISDDRERRVREINSKPQNDSTESTQINGNLQKDEYKSTELTTIR